MAPSRGIKRSVDGTFRSSNAALNREERTGKKPAHGKVVNFEEQPEVSTGSANSTSLSKLKQRSNELLAVRRQLPIWNHADEIRARLKTYDVLLLVAETGSGKSTQIPQFLVNEPWCRRRKVVDDIFVGGCIAITEPRRVAAISLARRVAEEMGTPLGTSSPASQVGYSVRFDNSTGPSTRIKFLTEGMLLQEMLRDPWLKDYSAVVVDEVHERGMNVDLVLGFLRRMQEQSHAHDQRGGNKMKVVVMSATADMDAIKDYFGPSTKQLDESGTANTDIKENEEWSGISDEDEKNTAINRKHSMNKSPVTTLVIKGRQHPVTIHYSPTPVPDILEATLQRITDIHTHSPLPGDILVFLTGQETVESLMSLVEAYSASIRKDSKLSTTLPLLLVLPLYAALPPQLQQRVFQPTPKFTRKIIIATNIAETSITVPGIRHVIDSGKHKRRLFRPSLNLDSLLTTPISRSNANQRSGRAGRDAPGHAYRLYTEQSYYSLAADTEPEILRCDLSQLVLTLKSHGVNDLSSFPLLTPPPNRALERAIMHLLQLSALSPTTGVITPMGREMSFLPLPSHLARILLSSSLQQYNCVDEIIDIVSALSVENIFLNVHTQASNFQDNFSRNQASDSESESLSDPRLTLRSRLHRREGDHLTLLATVQAYVSENTDRKRWCEERGISHRAMQAVMDARKQLVGIMKRRAQTQTQSKSTTDNGGEGVNGKQSPAENTVAHDHEAHQSPEHSRAIVEQEDVTTRILKTLLTGLHPNVARLSLSSNNPPSSSSSTTTTIKTSSSTTRTAHPNTPSYTTLSTSQQIHIHPSSVLFSTTLPPSSSSSHTTSVGTSAAGRDLGRRPRPEAIMSSEFVFTTKPYARCVSAVQLDWVRDVVASLSSGR